MSGESLADYAGKDALLALERDVAEARRQRDTVKAALKRSQDYAGELEAELDAITGVLSRQPKPPKWVSPARPKAGNHAIVTTILSDMHFDEVVNPHEMGGVNAYDRDIAEMRLKRYFERVIMLARDYTSGVTIDGFVLMLGGDSLTGEIHPELHRTNAASIPDGLLHWSELVAAGVDMLLDEFSKGVIVESPGNHGRQSLKVEPKQFSRRSYDWLLANMVAREFKRDDRATFLINEAMETRLQVYDTVYLLHHGMVGGSNAGSGIGGIWPTIMRDDARRRNMWQDTNAPYDIACMGHWHQYTWGPGQKFVINGSLKGYDEFAKSKSFGFEQPQQAWWLTTPEHGPTFTNGVKVGDRKREGW